MPQSLSSILIHLIFSTKYRESYITPEIESELHPYMASIFRSLKSPALALNGMPDHIHALFALSRLISIADLVEEVKTDSSKWIKTKGPEFRNFHWQNGYDAFSVGQSEMENVSRYIHSQKEHHRRVTFQDEYRKFLTTRGSNMTKDTYGIDLFRAFSAKRFFVAGSWADGSGYYIPRLWR